MEPITQPAFTIATTTTSPLSDMDVAGQQLTGQPVCCRPATMALIASGPYHCHTSAGIAVVRNAGCKSHF
eukprot:338088-Chlamydomonas_euryale.AAC.3